MKDALFCILIGIYAYHTSDSQTHVPKQIFPKIPTWVWVSPNLSHRNGGKNALEENVRTFLKTNLASAYE